MDQKLEALLKTLRSRRRELNEQGVMHAAVFGSVARGEPVTNDIDILVDLDAQKALGVYGFVGIKDQLSEILGQPVDLVEREALHPTIRNQVIREAVHVF